MEYDVVVTVAFLHLFNFLVLSSLLVYLLSAHTTIVPYGNVGTMLRTK